MTKQKVIPRIAARSVGGGMILMAYFTLAWMGIAISGLSGGLIAIPLLVFAPISLAILINGIRLLIVAKQFPASSASDREIGSRMGRSYGIIFGTEGLTIGLSSFLLSVFNQDTYIIPVIALAVGVHFYPMARLFKRNFDYYVATWTCIVALIGIWLLVANVASTQKVTVIVGSSCAIATTAYGLYMWRIKRRLLAMR